MITLLPKSPVFFEDTCDTGCFFETLHRIDQFDYDKKSHTIHCRFVCTECERYAIESETKFTVHFLTFPKEDWVKFITYIGITEPEN